MSRPLNGIKVLELDTFVASPCAGRLLADLGAEVIKIEKPTGDGWRTASIAYIPTEFNRDENPVYDMYNTGKKHIAVDMKTPEGMELFYKLLCESDIFLTNMRLKALKRLGITYDDIKEKYPRLIYAMVEGFGEKGAEADTAAYDTTGFWARCGMLRDLAVVDDETNTHNPIYPPSSVGDSITAYVLLSEINAALYERTNTGKGQLVKAGLYHTGIFTFGTMQIVCQKPFGKVYPKKRFEHTPASGYFKCKDGEYIYVATGLLKELFERMAKAVNLPHLYEDERFTTIAKCYENGEAYYNVLKKEFLKKTREEWVEICKSVDLAVTPVNGFADISEDPQALANGYIEEVEMPNGKVLKMPSALFDMESLRGEDMSTHPAPPVGHDTKEVLKQAGLTDEQIEILYEKGVIGSK